VKPAKHFAINAALWTFAALMLAALALVPVNAYYLLKLLAGW
jgi:hypothetical protein